MPSGFVGGAWVLERSFFAALASSSFFEALSVEAAFNASTCAVGLLPADATMALGVAEALPISRLPSVNLMDSRCPALPLYGASWPETNTESVLVLIISRESKLPLKSESDASK